MIFSPSILYFSKDDLCTLIVRKFSLLRFCFGFWNLVSCSKLVHQQCGTFWFFNSGVKFAAWVFIV